jgi:hypothetical protein
MYEEAQSVNDCVFVYIMEKEKKREVRGRWFYEDEAVKLKIANNTHTPPNPQVSCSLAPPHHNKLHLPSSPSVSRQHKTRTPETNNNNRHRIMEMNTIDRYWIIAPSTDVWDAGDPRQRDSLSFPKGSRRSRMLQIERGTVESLESAESPETSRGN